MRLVCVTEMQGYVHVSLYKIRLCGPGSSIGDYIDNQEIRTSYGRPLQSCTYYHETLLLGSIDSYSWSLQLSQVDALTMAERL